MLCSLAKIGFELISKDQRCVFFFDFRLWFDKWINRFQSKITEKLATIQIHVTLANKKHKMNIK
jgi:hypothetical protein